MDTHKTVKLLLFSFFGLLAIFLVAFLALGIISSKSFEGSIQEDLPISKRFIWKYLTEIDSLPVVRSDIEEIEHLGLNEFSLEKWLELTDSKGWVEMEFLEKVPDQKVRIKMTKSSFGMTGEWTYELLGEEDDQCTLIITEKSNSDRYVAKAMMILGGRESYLQNEMDLIKEVFKRESAKTAKNQSNTKGPE